MKTVKRSGAKTIMPAVFISSAAIVVALAGCNGNTSPTGPTGVIKQPEGPVATVNGTGIDREELHQFLEATGGENGLRQLVMFQMVMQEAKKNNLDVTDADIDKILDDRKKQNPAVAQQIDELTKGGGTRLAALKRQIAYQMAMENLLTKDIKVDDAALQKWFTANKERYGTPASVKIGFAVSSTKARADAMAQQLKAKTKTFEQLVADQKKAKDPAAASSTIEEKRDVPLSALPPETQAVLTKLKPGANTGSVSLAPGVFGIIHLVSKVDAKNPPLTEIRKQVERDYKLEQLARTIAKKTSPKVPFEQFLNSKSQEVAQQNMQRGVFTPPTRAEILQTITQAEMQTLMAKLQTGSKVEIKDTSYAALADEFKAPAGAAGAPGAPAGAPGAAGAPGSPAEGADPHAGHNH